MADATIRARLGRRSAQAGQKRDAPVRGDSEAYCTDSQPGALFAMNPPDRIHRAAAQGYAAAADTYLRGRPDYPAALLPWLQQQLGLGEQSLALDLGAGTGKFVPSLLASGSRVVAVEPVPQMLQKLHAAFPSVQALIGSAEAIPLADATLDAVVCAQSFHWFATPQALREIRRVLKPGGRLGLVWNMRDSRVPWVMRLAAIVDRHEDDTPRFRSGQWRRLFPGDGFGPLQEQQFDYVHSGRADDVILGRVLSTSFIAALPAAAQADVAAEVRQLIADEPALAGRETVSVPYTTLACCCEKLAASGDFA